MKRKISLLLTLLALALFWCGMAAADDAVPPLTVDGKTENIVLDLNGKPVIRVMTPEGATAVWVHAERPAGGDEHPEWQFQEFDEIFDRYRLLPVNELWGRTFWDQDVWTVTARYTTDEYDDGTDLWQAELNWQDFASVQVTVLPCNTQLNAPQISLSSTSVAQGGWINVTVSNFQHKDEWYWYELAYLEDEGGWNWFENKGVTLREGQINSFSIPTLDLEPGTYRLWVRTEAIGYEDNGTYKSFIVNEPDEAIDDGIYLSTSAVTVDAPLSISAKADGADWMQLLITMDEDPNWWDRRDLDGSAGSFTYDLDRAGTFRLALIAWEGEESTLVDTATLTVTSDGYLPNPRYSGFPGVLAAGQGLNGTVILDEQATHCYIELSYCPDDGDWTTLYRSDRDPAGTAEAVSLPASVFTQDGRYRIHVHSHATGLESSYNEYWFVRSSDTGSGVTLTVNGEAEELTLQSSEDAWIRINAPTATAARVLIGDRWEVRGSPDQFEFETGFGGGENAVVAQITTDEPFWNAEGFDWDSFRWETDVNWTTCSNAVIVHAENPYGRLNPPEITLDQSTVARGGWIHATVGNSQGHGEWYWAKIRILHRNDDGGTWWEDLMDCYGDSSEGFSIATAVLEPGEYYLCVGVDAVGWEGTEKSVPFTVTEGETDNLALYFPASTILTSKDIVFYAWAEGADYMVVDVTWEDNPGWRNHYDGGGDSNSWYWGCSQAGKYIFTLGAWQGEESLGETSFTLTVSAPYGNLETATTEGIPAVIEKNTAVAGTVVTDERTEGIGIQLYYCGEGNEWDSLYDRFSRIDGESPVEISFPAEYFSRTGIYRLEIHQNTMGYNGSHLNQQILVTDAELSQDLTVIVNGGSDEDIYLHQDLPVTVNAPQGVTAVRLWSSSYDWWDCHANVEGGLEWYWGFHQGGYETLIAQATTDASVLEWLEDPSHDGMRDFDWSQVSWTMTSSPVTVYVIKNGDLDDPEVEFPDGTTVERGEMLRMIVSPVENAYGFGVQLCRADDENRNWILDIDYAFGETGTVLIPTDNLEAGKYTVYIDPRCYGWQGNSVGYSFTVTQSDSWTDEAVFRVYPTEILTRESITFSAYAPGASEVRICYEDFENDWASAWGDSVMYHAMLSWEKVYHLTAYAYYPGEPYEDGRWELIGESDVNVTAPYGAMEIVSDTIPESVKSADSWTFSLLCDFKGTDGTVDCWITDPYYRWQADPELVSITEEGDFQRYTFQVNANTLEIGPYYLSVYVFPGKAGYALCYDERTITVSDKTIEAELTISPNPMEIFEETVIRLYAPDATAVALYGELNGIDWHCEPGDEVMEWQTAWWDGEYLFYGLYTTQEIDPDDPDFDWSSVHWEGTTAPVILTVNPPSAELEELDVVLESDTVKRGEKLKVTILNENPGLEVNYGAHLQAADAGDYDNGYTWFGPDPDDEKTIWIDTLEVPAGEYRVMVSSNAVSCHPVNTWIPVTVTEADDGPQMSVPEEAITGDTVWTVGYAKGATHLLLDVSFENGTWYSDPFEADGDCLIADVFTGEHPDTLILTLTAEYAGGGTETLQKTVTVTAPNGRLYPSITLNSAWLPGQDLDFTVNTGTPDAQYVAFVQEPGAEEAVFAEFVPPGTAVRNFVLSADDYEFEAGKTYEIRVIAAGTGYDGNETYLLITRPAALTTLNLPAGLQTIEAEAFAGVAAEKAVIPSGVTRIESGAFTDCPNLIELVLPEGITFFAADALGTTGPVFVYGPAGSYLEDYADAVDNLCFIPVN